MPDAIAQAARGAVDDAEERRRGTRLRCDYHAACVRAAAGPDGTRKGRDYMEIVRAHETALCKPVGAWSNEELERAIARVKREW